MYPDKPCGFGSGARLHRPEQFKDVFRHGAHSVDRLFAVRAIATSLGHARLGIAISRSCTRRSVVRHRLKRLIRESFRHRQQQLPAVDIVVIARALAANLSHEAVFASLDRHWLRLGRLCDKR